MRSTRLRMVCMAVVTALVAPNLAPHAAEAALPAVQVVGPRVTADGNTVGVRAGDLDGDGKADVVTWGTGDTGTLRRSGSPTATSVAFGGAPTSIRITDGDGDGDLDIVASLGALSGTPAVTGVSFVPGNGAGAFGAPIISATESGTNPITLAVATITGDALPDVVVASGGSVYLMPGTGGGSFGAASFEASLGGTVRDLTVADVTDDSKLDIVASARESTGSGTYAAYLHTLPGDGSGGFGASIKQSVSSDAKAIATGDVNEDGRADVVVIQPTIVSNLALLLGQPGTSLAAPVGRSFGSSLSAVALADVDGDTHLDLVGLGANALLLVGSGLGDGTFAPVVAYGNGAGGTGLAVADIKGSSDLDIAVTRPTEGTVAVYEGTGDGLLDGSSRQVPSGLAAPVIAGDANGDGRPDLIGAGTTAGKRLVIIPNDGVGRLLPAVTSDLPATPTGLAMCSLDGDGDPDVLATTTAGVSIVLSDGAGGLKAPSSVATAAATALIATDLDGDGDCDVAAVSPTTNSVLVLEGDGSGTLAGPTSLAIPFSPTALTSGDIDGDEDIDLLVGATTTVQPLINDGTATFSTASTLALTGSVSRMTTADFDLDGDADLAVLTGSTTTAKVQLLAGGPSGLAAPVIKASATSNDAFYGLAAGDPNQDGNPDLIMGAADQLLGRGDGTFDFVTPVYDPDRPSTVVAITDADGNGTPDFLGYPYTAVRPTITRTRVVPAPWAPFPSWEAYVDRLYQDLLGRPPSTVERAGAVSKLRAATLTTGGIVAAIRDSTEHELQVDPVIRLYRAYFLRDPDPSGLRYWISKRRAGRTLITISNSFATSSEFKNRYGKLTNAAFVDLVYENVLGRPGDAGGRAYWTKQLDQKRKSRGQVMLNFSDSSEYRVKQEHSTTASALYLLLLGRAPTATERTSVITSLEGGASVAELADALLRSAAYAAHIG